MNVDHEKIVRKALALEPREGGVKPVIPQRIVDYVEVAEKMMFLARNSNSLARDTIIAGLAAMTFANGVRQQIVLAQEGKLKPPVEEVDEDPPDEDADEDPDGEVKDLKSLVDNPED